MKTFPKGIHPNGNKHLAMDKAIVRMPAPKTVYIPVAQHLGAPSLPCVKVGDMVAVGQVIANAAPGLSSNIFASVSGKVKGIEKRNIASSGAFVDHIVIENDGLDTLSYLAPLTELTPDTIRNRLLEAGIVGMGGAGFPAHIKYSPKVPVDTLIINAAECEPYLSCDNRLMIELTAEFIQGVIYLSKALTESVKIVIGIEENKPEAIAAVQKYITENNIDATVETLMAKYPQGGEKQLIYAVTERKVPAGGLPMDVGCVVSNAHTALSTYYAVKEGMPLYERILTVSGKAVTEAKNIWVRTGTRYIDVLDFCGGESETESCRAVISGGPMTGFSIPNEERVSVTKTTSGILFLAESEVNTEKASQCINCAICAKVCPMNIMPMYIARDTIAQDYSGAKKIRRIELY